MENRRRHDRWVVLAVTTLVGLGALGLARFGYTMVLPSMQAALHLDNTGAGGLATANLIGYLAISALGGALAARFGPRRVTTAGMGLVALGMWGTGTAASFGSALSWRALTGMGSGASNIPAMSLTSAWFGPRLRGFAAGVAVSGSSLALIAIGPLVPRLLAARPEDGWRVVWFLFGAYALVMALVCWTALRDRPADSGPAALGEAGSLLPSRPTRAVLAAAEDPTGDGTIGPWAVAGGPISPEPSADSARERSARPARLALISGGLAWSSVYRSAAVWHLGGVYAAFGFGYIIYMTFFARYLVGELGYPPETAGDLFMLLGWFSLGCGLIWGSLSDRIGRRAALIFVNLIHALAFSMFVWWPALPGVALSSALFGLTAWSIPAIMAAVCSDLVGPRMAPAALGFVTLFLGVGQALGPSLAGAIADASGSFAGSLWLASGVALLGAGGAWRLRSQG